MHCQVILRSVFMACLLAAAPAAGKDIFVDNVTGHDAYRGDAPKVGEQGTGPLRTIAEALRQAAKRDRIVLANTGKPYRESLSLSTGRQSGDSLVPFVIAGNGATLDGSAPAPAADWQPVPKTNVIFRYRPPRVAYQQLFIDDVPAERVPVELNAPGLPSLDPRQWCLYQGDICFRPEPGKWIDQYKLRVAVLPVGITLYKVRNVTIADLVVQGFQLDGINAHDTQDCALLNVTCRGNGRSGVAAVGAARLTIREAVIGDNGAAQLLSDGYAITELFDSQLIGNTAPQIVRRGGQVLVRQRAAQ